jgi:hypothetical protein
MPEGYVGIDSGPFGRRAMSSSGVLLAFMEERNAENGDVAFWTRVVETQILQERGYELQERRPAGEGRAMIFSIPDDRLYLVVLFVAPRWVRIYQAGGPRAELERDLPRLIECAAEN